MVRQRERFTVAESFLERDSKVIPMEAKDIVENSNTLQDLVLAPPITGNLNVSAIGVRHPAAQELEKEVVSTLAPSLSTANSQLHGANDSVILMQ